MKRAITILAGIAAMLLQPGLVQAQVQHPAESQPHGDPGGELPALATDSSFSDHFREFLPATDEKNGTQTSPVSQGMPTRMRPRTGAPYDVEKASIEKTGVERESAKPAQTLPPTSPLPSPEAGQTSTSNVVRVALLLSLLAFLPALIMSMTSFLRIVVVLSMIRHAFGMPETPPNQVLVSLALFLTAFTMAPTLDAVNTTALQPFLDGRIQVSQAMAAASGPLRTFMLKQVHDTDIKAVYDMSRKPLPIRAQDVDMIRLVPAFMLNELRVSFRIGFVVLLPFLLIDLVVSSMLLAMGMMMVPPSTISLPLKVLMFVLIDGWSLVMQGLVGSIH